MGIKKTKMGAAPTAPCAPIGPSGCPSILPLPPIYRKPIGFLVNGEIVRLTGGRAFMLALLIARGSAGIDRAETWQWIANLPDTISALRAVGVTIITQKGLGARYVLACAAEKLSAAT